MSVIIDILQIFSRDLAALYHLEVAQFYGRYYEVEHVKTHVEMAQNIVGMEVTETGALGRRTKYQVRT